MSKTNFLHIFFDTIFNEQLLDKIFSYYRMWCNMFPYAFPLKVVCEKFFLIWLHMSLWEKNIRGHMRMNQKFFLIWLHMSLWEKIIWEHMRMKFSHENHMITYATFPTGKSHFLLWDRKHTRRMNLIQLKMFKTSLWEATVRWLINLKNCSNTWSTLTLLS